MHSRIIQLEREIENIENSPMTESTIVGDYDGPYFVGVIADYISDDVDRYDDINWFTSYLKTFNSDKNKVVELNGEEIIFKKGFKETYFKHRFDNFKKIANEFTLDKFVDSFEVYSITSEIDDKYGFYIYGIDNSLKTVDSFIRELPNEDIKYHIGTTLDYHC